MTYTKRAKEWLEKNQKGPYEYDIPAARGEAVLAFAAHLDSQPTPEPVSEPVEELPESRLPSDSDGCFVIGQDNRVIRKLNELIRAYNQHTTHE